jgi:hypothetical protein
VIKDASLLGIGQSHEAFRPYIDGFIIPPRTTIFQTIFIRSRLIATLGKPCLRILGLAKLQNLYLTLWNSSNLQRLSCPMFTLMDRPSIPPDLIFLWPPSQCGIPHQITQNTRSTKSILTLAMAASQKKFPETSRSLGSKALTKP